MNKIKVFITDDHEMFREGVKMLLSKSDNIEVIGEAVNGEDCLEKLPEEVDIILMDILMPVMDGIEATHQIIQKNPESKIIALSMFGEQEYYYKMIHSGVKGFVLKEAGSSELQNAISDVYKGENYFSQELLRSIIVNLSNPISEEENKTSDEFTAREKEILQQVCSGYTNKEIAEKLHISIRTVENHKANLIQKTGVKNTINLIVFSIKNKIVEI